VVDGVSIQVNRGEVVGLLGPNGAGKTTSFYMITGMVQPNSGRIFLDDTEITHEPMYKRARNGVGYLAQEASVFTKLSVEDNLKLVLQMTDLSSAEQNEKLETLLNEFSITHIRKSIAMTLSGGERRRTEIARSLVMDPDFILLDEPFAGIDPIAVEEIQKIIKGLKERGIGVLITDHNVRETLAITDRAYLLYEGKILKEGTITELANDEEARRLYLGSTFSLGNENG
jgi:lipopolysaccharide export system ATP-binding protein